MQIRLTQENEHALKIRLLEKPGLTTANKLANYFIAIGILLESEHRKSTRKHKSTKLEYEFVKCS